MLRSPILARVAAYDNAAEDPDYWAALCMPGRTRPSGEEATGESVGRAVRREIPDGVSDAMCAAAGPGGHGVWTRVWTVVACWPVPATIPPRGRCRR